MGKKGRRGDDDWEKEFELDEDGELKALKEPAVDEPVPAAKKKEKKSKKDKKNKKVAAFESEDDEPKLELAPAAAEEGKKEEAPGNQTKQKGGKKKGGAAGGSVFALLNGEEEEEEEEEEEAEPDTKADRLRICQLDAGGVTTAKVVTNAQNVEEGMKVVFAPVGCTTRSGMKIEQAVLRGVESFGMLCSAHECGWVSEPDGVLVVLPDDAEVGKECPEEPLEGTIYGVPSGKKDKEKKKKKSKHDTDGLFAALAGDEDGEAAEAEAEAEEVPAARIKSKKDKKKKKAADVSSVFAALSMGSQEAAEVAGEEEEDATAAKTCKKEEKKKKKLADADSLFAALAGDDEEEEAEPEPKKEEKKEEKKVKKANADIEGAALLGGDEEPAPTAGKKGKKDKKGKAAVADEEDLYVLLAELDGPKEQQPAAAAAAGPAAGGGRKDKKKKKGKGGAAKDEDEEDLDALLAVLGAAPAATEQPAVQQQAVAPAAASVEPAEAAEAEGEADGEGGEMSAAAKKKAKKKAKEKAKKAAAGGEEGEVGGEGGAAAAGGKSKKGGGPKVSGAVKRMQEALEAQRKAQEEAERLAEEQRLKEEEEERLREEEEARKKEEAERKKREKAERREQLKREGKLLTGKAKEEAERRARAAQQFLKQAGLNPDELPKKKPVYVSKKKQQKKKQEEQQQEETEAEAVPAAEEQPAVAACAGAAAATVALAAEEVVEAEAAVDSWEDAADDWEAMDVDQIKLPVQQNHQQLAEEEEEKRAAMANGKVKAGAAATGAKAAAVVNAAKAAVEEEEECSSEGEEGSDSEEGSSSEEDSSDEGSSEYSSSEEDSDSEDERETRLAAARERREAKLQEALAARDPKDLRSPICCILGHVDTGKTKILDNIRHTNVQDGEAGGITQQIGATYIPASAVESRTEELRKGRHFDLKLPGLLVIDTPGHESFSNLRSRGSGLCDIAVLVVDLMHGLEQQTIESINLLKMRKTPFIIALNKVDRLYNWRSVPNSPIQDAMAHQEEYVRKEFDDRLNQVALQLNEQGLNVALYWKNRDPRSFISIVPTSAITGEGIPDLLQLLVKLTQSLMVDRLMFVNNLESTVLEVKQIEGLGTTIDVVLVNGMLKEGDAIVVCGLGGPIVTAIRALLTPQPLKELRVKGQYVHHKELRAAMGVKIAAHNLESAVAGTQLYVVGPDDDVEDLKDAVMEDMQDIFSSVDKTGEGVCVQASTLGSLEALLEFLRSDEVKIAVSSINIGPINKKDVMRANAMIERGYRKFGVILAFDVPVTREAAALAEQLGVRIFTADIIYHLFDQFTTYLKTVKEEEQEAAKLTAVFPCVLKILPTCIFNQKDPIILGVEVVEGIAKVGTPICVPSRGGVDLGRIASLEKDHKAVDVAKRGDTVAMKIESTKPEEASRSYERHFDHTDELVSRITRKSINVLKDMFRDELSKDDWRLVIKLKKIFKID